MTIKIWFPDTAHAPCKLNYSGLEIKCEQLHAPATVFKEHSVRDQDFKNVKVKILNDILICLSFVEMDHNSMGKFSLVTWGLDLLGLQPEHSFLGIWTVGVG